MNMKTSSRRKHAKLSRNAPKPKRKPEKRPAPREREESDARRRRHCASAGTGWRIQSTNRRERGDYVLHVKGRFQLEEGQIADRRKSPQPEMARARGKLVEVFGDIDAVNAVSIARHCHARDSRRIFQRLWRRTEADAAQPVTLGVRADLRHTSLW
jgi:hypothetical protein